jgi:hypothetical protein
MEEMEILGGSGSLIPRHPAAAAPRESRSVELMKPILLEGSKFFELRGQSNATTKNHSPTFYYPASKVVD